MRVLKTELEMFHSGLVNHWRSWPVAGQVPSVQVPLKQELIRSIGQRKDITDRRLSASARAPPGT